MSTPRSRSADDPRALPWTLPGSLVRTISSVHGEVGSRWLAGLPQLLDDLAVTWQLRVGPLFEDLSYQIVARARRADGAEAVLKLGVPHAEMRREAAALQAYAGRHAVRLLACDLERGALLLERLLPGRTLARRVGHDGSGDDATTAIAADLMCRLWIRPEATGDFLSVRDWGAGFIRLRQRFEGGSGLLDAGLVDRAERLFASLSDSAEPAVLLHADLHHFNILSAGEGWKAIDPKGMLGDPAYEVGALLRNPWPELTGWPEPQRVLDRRASILAERLDIERQRILGWGLAQAVLSAWWSLEDGTGDGAFAMAVAGWLAGLPGAP